MAVFILIFFPITSFSRVLTSFCVIPYYFEFFSLQGASILMMIEQAMGEDVFKAGVQKYLKSHQFGNAASDDLWTALGNAASTLS